MLLAASDTTISIPRLSISILMATSCESQSMLYFYIRHIHKVNAYYGVLEYFLVYVIQYLYHTQLDFGVGIVRLLGNEVLYEVLYTERCSLDLHRVVSGSQKTKQWVENQVNWCLVFGNYCGRAWKAVFYDLLKADGASSPYKL